MVEDRYPLPSHWKPFVCTQEALLEVWEKFNQFPILFDDAYRGDFNSFVTDFFDKRTIVLRTGDYGLAIIKDITPHRSADIHLTFWDRRFKGRWEECRQALRWLFDKMDLIRAVAVIPEIAYSTKTFLKSLGFKEEGKIRKGFLYNGRLLDLCIFGILREEVFKESSREGDRDGKDKNGERNISSLSQGHQGIEEESDRTINGESVGGVSLLCTAEKEI